ncbi:hypothetical protein V6R94_03105 [Pediococcus acidilactici]
MQDVYDYYFRLSKKLGYDTYDYLPPQNEKVKYPFVYVGNLEGTPSQTKTNLTGSVVLNIDCWGTPKQRLIISEMVERFFMPRLVGSIPRTIVSMVMLNNNQSKCNWILAYLTQRLCEGW